MEAESTEKGAFIVNQLGLAGKATEEALKLTPQRKSRIVTAGLGEENGIPRTHEMKVRSRKLKRNIWGKIVEGLE